MQNSSSMSGMQLLTIDSQRHLFHMDQLGMYRNVEKAVSCLQSGNWSPINLRILNDWLDDLQNHPKPHSIVAVFDFDNTCIYGDVGNIVFRYQLAGLHFRLSPEQLSNLFPQNQESLCGKPFEPVKKRILSLYGKLWPFIKKNKQATVLGTSAHTELQNLFFWFYREARKDTLAGPLYTLPLMSRLLAGYTTDEVEWLTCQALVSAQQEPIAVTTKTKQVHCESLDNIVQVELATGLGVHTEITDLMDQLHYCGIRTCIVSASTEQVVKAAVRHLGFPVALEDVFGIRVQMDDNTLTTQLAADYPITYRTGKVEVINEKICAAPVMVVGDAVTDYEMLNIPNVPIRLIINHNRSGLISTLYDDPHFLLQGLDKTTGTFRPHSMTCEVNQE
jgi:phosphoserine phosphatase